MGCGDNRFYFPIPYPTPPRQMPEERRQSAKNILKERLARGEITLDEYQEMLNIMNGNDVNTSTRQKKSHIRMP